jgi:hypothetical protein
LGERLTVGDIAAGRSGDKGRTLDLTLVARDAEAYSRLLAISAATISELLGIPPGERHELPGLLALKFVFPDALDAGPWASRRAGVHWQKTAISPVLALELPQRDRSSSR